MENFGWDESYKAVEIGEASKVHLPPNALCFVANEPLIESCVERAKGLTL